MDTTIENPAKALEVSAGDMAYDPQQREVEEAAEAADSSKESIDQKGSGTASGRRPLHAAAQALDGFMQVPLSAIRAGKGQARTHFPKDELEGLADSIRIHGILQPIVVRFIGCAEYELVAGERRCRAARLAGLTHIPASLIEMSDDAATLAGLVENLQRQNLSPLEEGEAFAQLIKLPGYTYRNLGEKLGLERLKKGYIEDRVRVAAAPENVREMVRKRPDTLTHAREIATVKSDDVREDAISRTLAGMPLKDLRIFLTATKTNVPEPGDQQTAPEAEAPMVITEDHVGMAEERYGAGMEAVSGIALEEPVPQVDHNTAIDKLAADCGNPPDADVSNSILAEDPTAAESTEAVPDLGHLVEASLAFRKALESTTLRRGALRLRISNANS